MELFNILIGAISIIAYIIVSKIAGYIRKCFRKKTPSTPTISVAIDPILKEEIQNACRELYEKFGIKETMREFTLRALYRELRKYEGAQDSIEEAKGYIQQRELDKYNRHNRIVNEQQRREQLKEQSTNQIRDSYVRRD